MAVISFVALSASLIACVQVLQLQSATTSPQSSPIDYESGIEAMVLAILQQTNFSQQIELAELADLSLQITQDDLVADALLLTAYNAYLADALAANANLTDIIETSLLNLTTTSILPVSHPSWLCTSWLQLHQHIALIKQCTSMTDAHSYYMNAELAHCLTSCCAVVLCCI